MSRSRIRLASNALVGAGCARDLPTEIAERRVGVIVDAAVADQPSIRGLLADWTSDCLTLDPVFRSRSGAEPDYDYLDEVAARFREASPDALIAIGGGSTMDLGKGVAILLRNAGAGIDYRGVDRVRVSGVPLACIPTTAGSGSEATATASFVDRGTKTKLGINGRHVAAAVSALDPHAIEGCPRDVTVGSGLDALVHAVEAVTARTATAVSTALGCEAVRLLFASLPVAVRNPSDLDARTDTLVGAHLAALAMQNAAGGPASGVSYPLGVHYGVPHGYAGGVLLPHVVAANLAAGHRDGYDELARTVEADDFASALRSLYARLEAPLDLTRWNVGPGDVGPLTDLTLSERTENLDLNPVPFGRAELVELLTTATGGGR